jgi:hypothetical protein
MLRRRMRLRERGFGFGRLVLWQSLSQSQTSAGGCSAGSIRGVGVHIADCGNCVLLGNANLSPDVPAGVPESMGDFDGIFRRNHVCNNLLAGLDCRATALLLPVAQKSGPMTSLRRLATQEHQVPNRTTRTTR